jgi:curved DNA-binding protein CbpA
MGDDEYKGYYEILELDQGASLQEIREAYSNLRELYSSDSFLISPLMDELTEDKREEILKKIEEAYEKLTGLFKIDGSGADTGVGCYMAIDSELKKEIEGISSFCGRTLRQIRERLGIELHDIALATMIRTQYLQDIEEENFEDLPPEVYVRGYVSTYAKCLSLDPARVVEDYMSRYRVWKRSRD